MDAITYWPDDVKKDRPYFNAVLGEHTLFEDEDNTEIVTRAEVKTWLKIDGSFNDLIIDMLIPMCRAELEKEVSRSLISRQVRVALRYEVGDSGVAIPYGPLADDTDIVAYDKDGEVIDENNYVIEHRGHDHFLMTHYSFITIEFEAQPDSDQRLKKRLLEKIAYAFYNRGDKK